MLTKDYTRGSFTEKIDFRNLYIRPDMVKRLVN